MYINRKKVFAYKVNYVHIKVKYVHIQLICAYIEKYMSINRKV